MFSNAGFSCVITLQGSQQVNGGRTHGRIHISAIHNCLAIDFEMDWRMCAQVRRVVESIVFEPVKSSWL